MAETIKMKTLENILKVCKKNERIKIARCFCVVQRSVSCLTPQRQRREDVTLVSLILCGAPKLLSPLRDLVTSQSITTFPSGLTPCPQCMRQCAAPPHSNPILEWCQRATTVLTPMGLAHEGSPVAKAPPPPMVASLSYLAERQF